MDYESRKLLCHPKYTVSSQRDRVLKEIDGDESIDMPKSEDADNSRVLRAKLLASSDSIAFTAKLCVFVIADQTAIYTVKLYATESCTCPIKRNCNHILGVKIGQRMTINEEVHPLIFSTKFLFFILILINMQKNCTSAHCIQNECQLSGLKFGTKFGSLRMSWFLDLNYFAGTTFL